MNTEMQLTRVKLDFPKTSCIGALVRVVSEAERTLSYQILRVMNEDLHIPLRLQLCQELRESRILWWRCCSRHLLPQHTSLDPIVLVDFSLPLCWWWLDRSIFTTLALTANADAAALLVLQ